MALPPTVPTSFVPRPAASSVTRRSNFTGAFAFLGYGVLTIVIALAIGAFIYSQILATQRASTDQELQERVAAIDPHTVTKFVRLRDRLSYGLTLLNNHIALSGFWDTLIAISPSTVRYKSLHIAREDSGLIKLEASGVAKSFNALAATSDAFAGDGRVKDAIFSAIRVEGNVVNFALSASIDPELVAFAPTASSTLPTTPPPPRTSTTGSSTSPATP